ncbi:rod shape-determining protein RodA [Thermobifida halotolerans]|uniref:peptidoglycan glycosyltransferase n=1 Tax=Thermobifida halotolerans TaxID=483545 RepID=A0A399G3L8_9ACTN|nr:rod shape-determining protein RodA [Thermobifida halotolerans]UOE17899.1 rod shape-determining protein RodA [Thermobifida halotolerans]
MSLRSETSVRPASPGVRLRRLAVWAAPHRVDWVLLAAVLALGVLGVLVVWSATLSPDGSTGLTEYAWRHLGHLVLALLVCLAVASLGHRVVRACVPVVFAVATVGLLLVLTPLGEVINGARSWIVIGGLQAQPGEVAKIALILGVAVLLGEPRDGEPAPTTRDVLFSLAVLAVPMGLILLQPDLGTAMVLGAVYLAMLASSGASPRWVLLLLGCGLLGALAVWRFDLLKDYQVARFASFIDPGADPLGAGYNVNQALIAVGSGGLGGSGLFRGEQTSGKFVPEQHTDFIFTVVAEELGFVGGSAAIVLLGVVLLRVLRVAARCGHPYGRLVCVGVAAWICFQAFVNIGMTLGLTPVTGLPLPFVSYGGSAAVANLTGIGLVLAVRAHDREAE